MHMVAELRAPSKRGRAIKPVRVAPRPDRPFAEGILPEETPLSCPIDQRPRPTIQGVGLEQHESWKINAAFNAAFADHALDNPEASLIECDQVARKAAIAELSRVLRDRPAAPPLKAKKRTHTPEDERWWSERHIAIELGLAPVCGGQDGPEEPEMSDFHDWLYTAAPDLPLDLSDDRNGGFVGELLDF